MSLITVIYVSSSKRRMTTLELESLLTAARDFNGRHQITGMLLYRDGNFMQVIEGEQADVESLYARIQVDSRHQGVITLVQEPIGSREFAGWQMGFENIDLLRHTLVNNAVPALGSAGQDLLHGQNAGRSRRLLAGFLDRALR